MGSWAELIEQTPTHQATLRKGEANGLQKAILSLGEKRFGGPPDAVAQRIGSTTDVSKLQAWLENVLSADGWDAVVRS